MKEKEETPAILTIPLQTCEGTLEWLQIGQKNWKTKLQCADCGTPLPYDHHRATPPRCTNCNIKHIGLKHGVYGWNKKHEQKR